MASWKSPLGFYAVQLGKWGPPFWAAPAHFTLTVVGSHIFGCFGDCLWRIASHFGLPRIVLIRDPLSFFLEGDFFGQTLGAF